MDKRIHYSDINRNAPVTNFEEKIVRGAFCVCIRFSDNKFVIGLFFNEIKEIKGCGMMVLLEATPLQPFFLLLTEHMIITQTSNKSKQEALRQRLQDTELQRINELLEIFKQSRDYEQLSKLFLEADKYPDDLALKLRYSRLQKFVLQLATKQLLFSNSNEQFKRIVTCSDIYSSTYNKKRNFPVYSSLTSSRFSEIQMCGSTWSCPFCSAYISEQRKQEIFTALKKFRAERFGCYVTKQLSIPEYDYYSKKGGEVRMVTFTVPHDKSYLLLNFVTRFNECFREMKAHDSYKQWRKRNKIEGTIHVLEVTYGEKNGWHVHAHVAYFMSNDVVTDSELLGLPLVVTTEKGHELDYSVRPYGKKKSLGDCFYSDSKGRIFYEYYGDFIALPGATTRNIGVGLFPQWVKAVLRGGFSLPSPRYGISISNGDALADYLSKWGREPKSLWDLSLELSKQHVRQKDSQLSSENGVISRASPFDLLRRYAFAGDIKAGDLFIEFSRAFKGKHNINWSQDFKKQMGVNDSSDEELLEKVDELTLLGSVTYGQYKLLQKSKARGTFLDICQEKGFAQALSYLDSLGLYKDLGVTHLHGFLSYEELVQMSIERYKKQGKHFLYVSNEEFQQYEN